MATLLSGCSAPKGWGGPTLPAESILDGMAKSEAPAFEKKGEADRLKESVDSFPPKVSHEEMDTLTRTLIVPGGGAFRIKKAKIFPEFDNWMKEKGKQNLLPENVSRFIFYVPGSNKYFSFEMRRDWEEYYGLELPPGKYYGYIMQ